MKNKNILYLITILISLFTFNLNVNAAQELTCIYKGGVQEDAVMLVQNADGELYFYTNSKNKKPTINDKNWYSIVENDNNEIAPPNFENTKYYENGNLTDCPQYTRYKAKARVKIKYTFNFYDKKGFWTLDYPLYKKYNELPSMSNFKQDFDSDKDYTEEINNTTWLGICNYEDVVLYFNRDKLLLSNKSPVIYHSTAGFSLNELLEYYDESGACPARIYQNTNNCAVTIGNTACLATYHLSNEGNSYEEEFIKEGSSINNNYEEELPQDDIEDCLDLFSQDFISQINSLLSIIRIAVPVLLVGLGILDFAKAIFSSSEDEMKKAQAKFMKRIIAAVIVFLIPLFINLLLNIANSVWNNIDPNSCNIG